VDNHSSNLLVLENVLKPIGYTVDKALSGDEALKLCLKNEYDLFILDVQMPNMHGFELAENLKSINRTKEIPIIFLTAISKEDKFVIKGYEVGAVDYLTKPINDELLNLKVSLFLQLHYQKKYIQSLNKALDEKVKIRTQLLRQKTEILEGILTSVKECIALLDKKGNIVITNKAWNEFSAKNNQNSICTGKVGENYLDKIKTEEKKDPVFSIVHRAFLRVLEGKENDFHMEYPCKLANNVHWFFMSVTPYGNNDGVVVSHTEITDSKLKAEAIKLSERKLKNVVDNISDAIFSVDNNFNIISWNKSCKNIYGFSEKEVINQAMDKIFHTKYLNSSISDVKNQLKNNNVWSGEITQKNKSGNAIIINANYKVIKDNEAKKIGIAVLNKDITIIRKNEIELTNALILGEENERKRIASNLHDGLGQYLSGLRMHLQVIKEDVEEEYYSNLISLIDTAIKEYRSVSHNIIPPNLSKDGLIEAIKLMCNKLNSDKVEINFNTQLKDTKTGIGLKNILSRIHFLKGKIKIDSKIGKGSQFKINIKL